MLEAEVRQYHRSTAAHPVVVAYGGLPDISCLVSCRPWEPRAAVPLLAHATYFNVKGVLMLVGEKALKWHRQPAAAPKPPLVPDDTI